MERIDKNIIILLLSVIAICAVITTYFIVSDLYAYDFEKITNYCLDKKEGCDAISIAYQLGRLDFVSVCLAALGVIVGLSAVFGFLGIKEKSEYLAKKTTEDKLKEYDVTMPSMLESKVTVLFDRYMALKEQEQNCGQPPQDDWATKVEDE
ncbi:hypothetical protein QNE29_004352 [Vibrio vulnificus]|nr:hypothetical protein [Vibrio vulnificus]MCU8247134.1 hypothetical protein [Vibrio vulnificus]